MRQVNHVKRSGAQHFYEIVNHGGKRAMRLVGGGCFCADSWGKEEGRKY